MLIFIAKETCKQMRTIIQTILSFFLLLTGLSLSASPLILSDVLNVTRTALSKQTDTLYVRETEDSRIYVFAELAISGGDGFNKQLVTQFSQQLEQLNWIKPDFETSYPEFDLQFTKSCKLFLTLVDKAYAGRIFASIKEFPDAVYFYLVPKAGCDYDWLDKKITSQYPTIETYTEADLMKVKQPPQPYGDIRRTIPTYSVSLDLEDLIDFASHQTLSPLAKCHTESLFSAGLDGKVACLSEDRSSYSSYVNLNENKVYKSKPYLSSRTGLFFRKQGFKAMQGAAAIVKQEQQDYIRAAKKNNLPSIADVGFIMEINPRGCLIATWLFKPVEDSPLWNGIKYKTIKVKKEDEAIQLIKMYEKMPYLVSIVTVEGC